MLVLGQTWILLSQSLTDEICPYGREARGRVGENKSSPTRFIAEPHR